MQCLAQSSGLVTQAFEVVEKTLAFLFAILFQGVQGLLPMAVLDDWFRLFRDLSAHGRRGFAELSQLLPQSVVFFFQSAEGKIAVLGFGSLPGQSVSLFAGLLKLRFGLADHLTQGTDLARALSH